MSKHTPGPWAIVPDSNDIVSKTKDGLTGRWICEILESLSSNSGGGVYVSIDKERAANARLIAASPDGLEFAQSFIVWIEQLRAAGLTRKAMLPGMEAREREARAFISKATGE